LGSPKSPSIPEAEARQKGLFYEGILEKENDYLQEKTGAVSPSRKHTEKWRRDHATKGKVEGPKEIKARRKITPGGENAT